MPPHHAVHLSLWPFKQNTLNIQLTIYLMASLRGALLPLSQQADDIQTIQGDRNPPLSISSVNPSI